jgi:hypothetical protein
MEAVICSDLDLDERSRTEIQTRGFTMKYVNNPSNADGRLHGQNITLPLCNQKFHHMIQNSQPSDPSPANLIQSTSSHPIHITLILILFPLYRYLYLTWCAQH